MWRLQCPIPGAPLILLRRLNRHERPIAITSPKEPLLGKSADVCLSTGVRALSIYGSAIFSRIPDLAVVDLLYMGIIQSDYERFSRSLDKSGAVIADRGYGDE